VTLALDLVRYTVVLEAAFALGLSGAVAWRWWSGVPVRRALAQLLASFDMLVFVAAWSEFGRIGSPELGWYVPVKLAALTLALWALAGLWAQRPERG
jgi:hypothetical protein